MLYVSPCFSPQDMLSKHLPPPAKDNLVMVCGPPGMMDAISGNKAKDYSQVGVQGGAGVAVQVCGVGGWVGGREAVTRSHGLGRSEEGGNNVGGGRVCGLGEWGGRKWGGEDQGLGRQVASGVRVKREEAV